MTPPRIAVDLRALVGQPTGIGWATLALIDRLARRRAYRILGLAHAEPHRSQALRDAGVELETHRAPLGVVFQQHHLPRRLARGDAALLWSPINVLPWRSPVPAVVTVHDLTAVLMPEFHRLTVRWSVLPFLERTLATARRVVADSESTARDLRRLYPQCEERIRVVPVGIEEEFRPAAPPEVESIRRELGCPQGYLLSVGTLEPRKNLGFLVDVWEALKRDDPQVPPLVVAGGYGWSSRSLVARLERLEPLGLRWLGRLERSRLVRVMQGARAFVFPSLYEGFGLPPAEAMACGIPTLASDRSSLPEVVGDAGLLFDPEQPDDLAAALRRLLADDELAGDLAQRGRERARRFDLDTAAGGMEEVFRQALR